MVASINLVMVSQSNILTEILSLIAKFQWSYDPASFQANLTLTAHPV